MERNSERRLVELVPGEAARGRALTPVRVAGPAPTLPPYFAQHQPFLVPADHYGRPELALAEDHDRWLHGVARHDTSRDRSEPSQHHHHRRKKHHHHHHRSPWHHSSSRRHDDDRDDDDDDDHRDDHRDLAVERIAELQELTRDQLEEIRQKLSDQAPPPLVKKKQPVEEEIPRGRVAMAATPVVAARTMPAPDEKMEAWSVAAVANAVLYCCEQHAEESEVRGNSYEIANAFYQGEVDGAAFLELMVDRAACREFLSLEVQNVGSRLSLAHSLHKFVDVHRGLDWAFVRGAVGERDFPLVPRVRWADDVQAEPLHRFCAKDPEKFAALLKSLPPEAEQDAKYPVIALPIFVTVLVKELKEEVGNADQIVMSGTFLIRSLIDTDRLVDETGSPALRPKFKINEREDTDEFLRERSSKVSVVKVAKDCKVAMRSTTYSFEVPLKRQNIFNRAPFNITAFEMALEFKPITARVPQHGSQMYTFLPDLLCPVRDLRNMITVRHYQLDELNRYDIINPNPSVEVDIVAKDGLVHAPKMQLTFYGDTDAVRAAMNIIIPIVFVAYGNVLNVMYTNDYNDFLANALTLGLTLVFFLPTLNTIESVSNDWDLNQILVAMLFLGLLLGCSECAQCEISTSKRLVPHSWKNTRHTIRVLSFFFLWIAVIFPIYHLALYYRVKYHLRPASRDKADSADTDRSHAIASFTGKPPKQNFFRSNMADLAPFWDAQSRGPAMNPDLNVNWPETPAWTSEKYRGSTTVRHGVPAKAISGSKPYYQERAKIATEAASKTASLSKIHTTPPTPTNMMIKP